MGWVKERVSQDGKKQYMGVYRDLDGRERSAGTFSSEKKAANEAAKAEGQIDAGRVGDPRRGRQTVRRYVEEEWFPNHVIEAKTRENYTYLLNRYILPELGARRMVEVLPGHVREWVLRLQDVHGARPPTIREAKVVLDAVFTTALNDQVTFLHPGKGVRTPPVAKKPKRIITAEQFDKVHAAITDPVMRLLVETDMGSGLRWGELSELRVKDLDQSTGMLIVSRVVVQLLAKDRPDGVSFLVKDYPKDKEWREVKLDASLTAKLVEHIDQNRLGAQDLLFWMPQPDGPARRRRPAVLPDPATLGLAEPNEKGRRYQHGTATGYGPGRCRCQFCKDAVATYRAARRAAGKDAPRTPRSVTTDGHIPAGWFRTKIWYPALDAADIGVRITPHGMRHAHASWLLAGGADLQVVKERLGHGSITTTEKYLHSLPGAHDAALSALASIRGPHGNSEPTAAAHDDPNGRAAKRPPQPKKPGKAKKSPSKRDRLEAELSEMRAAVNQLTQLLADRERTP